ALRRPTTPPSRSPTTRPNEPASGGGEVRSVAPRSLSLVQSDIGAGDGVLGALAGAPDGDAGRARPVLRDAAAQALGHLAGDVGVAIEQQQPELLPAQPRQQVAGAQLIAPGGGGLLEQAIAGRVAVGVVELLEMVEVDHRND